jgi:hypothetical protein
MSAIVAPIARIGSGGPCWRCPDAVAWHWEARGLFVAVPPRVAGGSDRLENPLSEAERSDREAEEVRDECRYEHDQRCNRGVDRACGFDRPVGTPGLLITLEPHS